jgi:hypothetical protein
MFMKKPKVTPDSSVELEIARRLAKNHLLDAARALTDATLHVPFHLRQLWTTITGGILTLARRLDELTPPDVHLETHHVSVLPIKMNKRV